MLLASPAAADPARERVLAEVTRALCDKRVALLGQTGNHGDGETFAFKAALVRRLLTRCGYRALLFEAGMYDFVEIDRRRRMGAPTTPAMLSSAIGGLWRDDREVAELVPFLHAAVRAGRLYVGGVDDNLGSAGAFYSLDAMPGELVRYLRPDDRPAARETLRRLIYADYGEAGPSARDRDAALACVAAIRKRLRRAPPDRRAELTWLLDNVASYAARLSLPSVDADAARERAMYGNYTRIRRQLPAGTKVILWGATVHLARELGGGAAVSGGATLGGYVHRRAGGSAFSLAFTAQGGSVRTSRRGPPQSLPTPPADSLEAVALDPGQDIAYLSRHALARLGRRPAGILRHRYVPLDLATVADGVVVFRRERPPAPADE